MAQISSFFGLFPHNNLVSTWFAGRSAMLYSHIATCKLHQVNLIDWMIDIIERISNTKPDQLDQLLPQNWIKNRKVQKITPFRELIEISA